MEKDITTVGELKEFIKDFDDDIQVRFADRDCLPCKPYKFKIYSNALYFVNKNIAKDFVGRYLEDMHACKTEDNAIVIHARY